MTTIDKLSIRRMGLLMLMRNYVRHTEERIQNIEEMKQARCEGEKQRVPKGQVITEAEDVHEDMASERASVGSSTDDHNGVQSVDSSSDNDYNNDSSN